MGIRVLKVVGYGLTDLQATEDAITDPRINPDGYLGCDCETQEERWTVAGYRKYVLGREREKSPDGTHFEIFETIERQDCKRRWRNRDDRCWDPCNSVIYDPEFGLPTVLVVIPRFNHKEWRRYDNLIDYSEETSVHGAESRVSLLKNGIYPHVEKRDAKTWASVSQTAARRRRRNGDPTLVPDVPYGVRVICEYLDMFSDPLTYRQLRPLLYVFWA